MNIILIGFKNSGKTTIGKLLSAKLNMEFIDTDSLIEKYYLNKTNLSLLNYQIHQKEGEGQFREIEKEAINTLATVNNTVIASGGGSVLKQDNVKLFQQIGKILYLYVPYEILLERILQGRLATFLDPNNPEKSFMKMFEDRKEIYANIADYQINAFNRDNETIMEEIMQLVGWAEQSKAQQNNNVGLRYTQPNLPKSNHTEK